MTTKHVVLFLFVFSIVLTACGAQATPVPVPTATDVPSATPTATFPPPPTFTPTAAPTLVPLTPTYGPPAAVMNLFVKKTKCIVYKPTKAMPYYHADILFVLAWEDVSDNEDGFWLYRDGNRVAELPPNTTVYNDVFTPRKPGRTSTYFIVAYNSAGETKGEVESFANPC